MRIGRDKPVRKAYESNRGCSRVYKTTSMTMPVLHRR